MSIHLKMNLKDKINLSTDLISETSIQYLTCDSKDKFKEGK